MTTFWDFHSAGRLIYGPGLIRHWAQHRPSAHSKTCLIITDSHLVEAGLVDRVLDGMDQEARKQVHVFDEGEAEPSIQTAFRAAACAQAIEPGTIIGLGGGSNMDLAKITGLVYSHGGHPSDYFGFDRVPGPICPIVAIPTTAGTGSEVSHAAVLSDQDSGVKVSTLSPHLRPTLALVDPELTHSCPPQVTAESGMDALTHAIEAYTARIPDASPENGFQDAPYPGKNPLSDALAQKAISLVSRHLLTAFHQPADAEARNGMALAGTLAGLAFSNGAVALVHALEYPMGMDVHCSHGRGNALLLPHVMRFNMPYRMTEMADIAQFMGLKGPSTTPVKAAETAIEHIESLNQSLSLPRRIRDLGGSSQDLPRWAEKAFQIKRLMDINPRTPTQEDLLDILKAAL